jgi:ABC-type transporter Mla maintaining outer membrane lipid asymmetry permease subunit MlaE
MMSSNLIRKSSRTLSNLLADRFLRYFEGHVKIWTVFCRLWGATFAGPAYFGTIFRDMAKQIYFTSVRGVYILIFVGLMLGLELILNTQQLAQMVKVPLEDYLGSLLATVVVRELSPVIAALFVLIHSSGAIVSEIGTMSVEGEIAALQIMGIDPYRYLGVPRFWAMTISVICLNFLVTFCSVASGYLVQFPAFFQQFAPTPGPGRQFPQGGHLRHGHFHGGHLCGLREPGRHGRSGEKNGRGGVVESLALRFHGFPHYQRLPIISGPLQQYLTAFGPWR